MLNQYNELLENIHINDSLSNKLLHIACEKNNYEQFTILIPIQSIFLLFFNEEGSKKIYFFNSALIIAIKLWFNNTALIIAVKQKNIKIVDLLLQDK